MSYKTLEEQEADIRIRLPEMGISDLEELLVSYRTHDCQVYSVEVGEMVWQYAESIQLVSEELKIRRGY